MTTEIQIKGFHPLNVTLPEDKELIGKVRIVLPDIHVQVYDLSMGGIIPDGPHLGADVPMYSLDIELPEPVETAKIMVFIVEARDELEKLWAAAQVRFDEPGALL